MACNANELPESWREPVSSFLDYLGALGYSPETVRTRRNLMRLFALGADCGPDAVETRDLLRFMGAARALNSKKNRKNTVSSFFKWYCHVERRRADNPAATLPSMRKPRPHPKPVPDGAIRNALGEATAQERVMVLLAAECGLRRGEIALVHSRDVVDDSGGGKSLIVHGKGDRQRIVPLPSDLAAYITAAGGWLLPGRFGGHVEASYVSKHVGRLLPDGYSVHKLRHRFATTAYAESHDMLAVSKALGHASTETTMAYTALPDERLRPLVDAATMTIQPPRKPTQPPEPEPCRPLLLPITPERPAERPRRRDDGKIHYRYENGNIQRRKRAGRPVPPSTPVLLAAVWLSWKCADITEQREQRSFDIPAEAFCERLGIEPDGHARRSSTLRAAARLMQSAGLIELTGGRDGTLRGNITTDTEQLRAYCDDVWRLWNERRDKQR